MKKNKFEVVLVVDESGSMYGIKKDVVGGINSFVDSQKNDGTETFVTVAFFDRNHFGSEEFIRVKADCYLADHLPKFKDDDYNPRGGTPLYDAVGEMIERIGKRLAETPEEERPEKVTFLIITDGEENSSSDNYKNGKLKEMITHQESVYGWEFNYIGANVDSFANGSEMGISKDNVANFTASAQGCVSTFAGLGANYNTRKYKMTGAVADSVDTTLSNYVKTEI